MKELEYPFDSEMLLKKKKNLRKQLLEMPGKSFLKRKTSIRQHPPKMPQLRHFRGFLGV